MTAPLTPEYEAALRKTAAAHTNNRDTAVYRGQLAVLLDELDQLRKQLDAKDGTARYWRERAYRSENVRWDSELPPGGEVCATCGQPVESEPCPDHSPAAEIDRLRARVVDLERPVDSYPPSLPWAQLMDDEDLSDFLDELKDAAHRFGPPAEALADVEKACGTWRLIAEAQHAHNAAPGPNAEAGESR